MGGHPAQEGCSRIDASRGYPIPSPDSPIPRSRPSMCPALLPDQVPKLPDAEDAERSSALQADGHHQALHATPILLACLGSEVRCARQGARRRAVRRPSRPGKNVPEHKRLGRFTMKLIQSLARHVDSSLKPQSDPQNAGRIHQCPKKPCRASDVSFSRWLQPKSVF